MSTQRYIETAFWDDTWVQELDPSEKLVYIYLLTNPLTNIAGIMELSTKRMCFDTGFNSDTITHILDKFEKAKKVFRYQNYIIVRNFPKHQRLSSDKILKGIAAIISKLPKNVIKFLVDIDYQFDVKKAFIYDTDTISISYPYDSNYLNLDLNSNLNLNSDLNKGSEQTAKCTKSVQMLQNCTPELEIEKEIELEKELKLDLKKDIELDLNSCSEQTSCSEPEEPHDSTISLILNDNSEWTPSKSEIDEFSKLYPNVDVIAELRKMRGWCLGNPKRRKTRYGIKRFVTSWLGKEQDRPSKTRTEKNYGYTIHTDEEYAAGADDLTKVTF